MVALRHTLRRVAAPAPMVLMPTQPQAMGQPAGTHAMERAARERTGEMAARAVTADIPSRTPETVVTALPFALVLLVMAVAQPRKQEVAATAATQGMAGRAFRDKILRQGTAPVGVKAEAAAVAAPAAIRELPMLGAEMGETAAAIGPAATAALRMRRTETPVVACQGVLARRVVALARDCSATGLQEQVEQAEPAEQGVQVTYLCAQSAGLAVREIRMAAMGPRALREGPMEVPARQGQMAPQEYPAPSFVIGAAC